MRVRYARDFFDFARKRHLIFLARSAGLPGPWTDDPTLQTVRFTNVFRELDRTTIWFRRNIRDHLRDDPWVVPATIIFRWFNRIETGQVMAPILIHRGARTHDQLITALETAIRSAIPKGPWVTGSYMVCSGHNRGEDKLSGMLRYCRQMLSWWEGMDGLEGGRLARDRWWLQTRPTLRQAHEQLVKLEGLAGFTAYEVVSDLRWTAAVRPVDRDLWAHAGPGATRGGSRVLHREPDRLRQESAHDQYTLRLLMKDLLRRSRDASYWPQDHPDWPRWEMREVEHTLCEFDKYERVRRGQGRAKRTFRLEGSQPLPPSGLSL